MTKFNPENKVTLTYGEALEPAMNITDQADADQYKADYIAYEEQFLINGKSESGLTAEQIVNTNLGYFAGYYSNETRERVERLFKCSHPIFGNIKENSIPTTKESFELGLKRGKDLVSKVILILITLLFISCEKETIENFTLEVWKENGILHIDYHSEIKGFTIWVSPDENHEDSRTQKFTMQSYGCDQSTSYFWTPTYVTMENSEASKTIKVE